jgi:tripartite-type tricarboxylate transporter receptor subunit TctC
MTLPRRQFLRLAASAAALPAMPRFAWSQAYPTRPVRLIVGFPAGGGVDIPARMIGQWLSERLGQSFVIENRPGAGTNIGTEAVVRAPPDGYTLLLVNSANAINATLHEKLSFNFIRDIDPIASIMRQPIVLLVNRSVPANSVSEFIAYAKANPGKLNMASAGDGTPSHLAGELFKMMTGIDVVQVPYRGVGPAMTDLLGGQMHFLFTSTGSSIDHINSGKLRPLAVTTATRSELLPELPTMGDFVPGFEASQWYGMGAPRGTPAAVIDKLNKEINAALADPKMKARFADLGGVAIAGSPSDFAKLIADETERLGKVIRALKNTPG